MFIAVGCDSIKLNCNFKNIDWGGLGKLITCDVEGPRIYNLTTVSEVEENSSMFLSPVTAFRNNNNEWNFIPNSIAKFFPNIQTFQVISSKLTQISKENFIGFNQLTDLNLWQNDLIEISADTFDHLSNLQGLYLSWNKIEQISAETFANLHELSVLHLNENRIEKLPRNIFKNNLNLKEISLANNKINYIHYKTFEKLMSLKKINMIGNICINLKFNEPDNMKTLKTELMTCYGNYIVLMELVEVKNCQNNTNFYKNSFVDSLVFRIFFGDWSWIRN